MRPTIPAFVRVSAAVLVVAGLAFVVQATTGLGGPDVRALFATHVYRLIMTCAFLIVAARVVRVRAQRTAFALLALGLLLTLGGDALWDLAYAGDGEVPVPSVADVLYVAAYVPFGLAVWRLISRTRTRALASGLGLDGVVVSLTVVTVLAYVMLPSLRNGWEGSDAAGVATNAAYPLADAALVAALLSSLALRDWRPDRRCVLLAFAFCAFVASDAVYLVQAADDAYEPGSPVDLGWLVAGAAMAASAWMATPDAAERTATRRVSVLVPSVAGALSIALLAVDQIGSDHEWVLFPVSITALLIFVRFSLVSHDNHRLIDHNRTEAVTDALTGLANRRRLLEDLGRPHDRDRVLVLFDLDGFKAYNDTFGHPAGDVLLQMIGQDLRTAIDGAGTGTAYRLGGDEFCAVLATDADPEALGARLAEAMARAGHGFHVGASYGTTVVAAGAPAADRTLTDADERLYARKNSRRASADHQSAEVLLAVLAERTPDLGEHVDIVADLSSAVAERLGMRPSEILQVRRAAALHDIGKMAIPDSILGKPGPLDDDEWRLMRQHTVIGERILAAAPALRPVAEIVRSTHERWDGGGYPDGAAGEAIPLGARIVFACDAFDAMTASRPYTRPRPAAEAIAELVRCAGTQFDPRVVEALTAELRRRAATNSLPHEPGTTELPPDPFTPSAIRAAAGGGARAA